MRRTLYRFFSRISSTVYSTTNPIVLNMFYAGLPVVGFYSASEKFLSVSKSIVSPIADSLYPYMVKNKDFRLVKKILITTTPFIVVGAAVLYIYANQICEFVFGPSYVEAGMIVRCLLPAIIVIFPSYVICFPVLVPHRPFIKGKFFKFYWSLRPAAFTYHSCCN